MEKRKEIKIDLIDEICKEYDFDELLLEIITNEGKSEINELLQKLDENIQIDNEIKKQLYSKIFEYVNLINNSFKNNIKTVFSKGVEQAIIKINSYNNESSEREYRMSRNIRIIIADDNVYWCELIKKFLENYKDIEILGIANTDEDEVKMIEELNPDIVLTDLMRNHKYTGLEIIKEYKEKNEDVAFLVISADSKENVINNGLDVEGYIKKPISDYEIVYEELKRIKKELEHKKYLQWDEKYHNEQIVNLKNMLTLKERNVLKKLGFYIKNKKYTAYEIECLELNLLVYYDDSEDDLTEEERKEQKLLHGTGVNRDEYNQILAKIEKIKEELIF